MRNTAVFSFFIFIFLSFFSLHFFSSSFLGSQTITRAQYLSFGYDNNGVEALVTKSRSGLSVGSGMTHSSVIAGRAYHPSSCIAEVWF